MIGIVVLAHGTVAEGLVETTEMIVGEQAQLTAVPFDGKIDVADYRDQVVAAASKVDGGEGILFLVDLQGGTPCNVAAYLSAASKARVVSGVNVPMLVTVVLSRAGLALEPLARMARDAGIEGIQDVKLEMEE
ncbi:MAG: PTS sugar transporter subunit IIA [Bacillota bacterium]|jgi:mannose/fructose/sorbose-specific phosphotransferase system IIA component|nr:PTS sugar transporter subunit IIA [Bacillota bacterium]HHT89662.1 PTS sugar transporter subunit IIA [Bacillota bacterium]